MLPFTHQQFLDLFAAYNEAVWPAQPAAYLLALGACAALALRRRGAGRMAAGVLALGWLWTGVVFHGLHFARINPAATAFAALFCVQGLLFVAVAVRRGAWLRPGRGWRAWPGWGLVAYAMLLYPAIGVAVGGRYPALPMFGITPCPLTLFTLGVLLLGERATPWWLLVVPGAWCVVGGSAAFLLQVPQDWPLLAGVLLVPVLALPPRTPAFRCARGDVTSGGA